MRLKTAVSVSSRRSAGKERVHTDGPATEKAPYGAMFDGFDFGKSPGNGFGKHVRTAVTCHSEGWGYMHSCATDPAPDSCDVLAQTMNNCIAGRQNNQLFKTVITLIINHNRINTTTQQADNPA